VNVAEDSLEVQMDPLVFLSVGRVVDMERVHHLARVSVTMDLEEKTVPFHVLRVDGDHLVATRVLVTMMPRVIL